MHGVVGTGRVDQSCEAQKERRFHRQHICHFINTQQYKIHITNHVAIAVWTRVSTNMWHCTFRSHLLFFLEKDLMYLLYTICQFMRYYNGIFNVLFS